MTARMLVGVCLNFGISPPPASHKQRCKPEQGAARWDGKVGAVVPG